MYTNVEFLDTEPIENLITAMHFKMDKVVFLGYAEVIKDYKKQTESFLMKYCGVKEVDFRTVSKTDLMSVLDTLSNVIKDEKKVGNQVYFDITGGEELILVAFGMLAKEHSLPMHLYQIEEDKLYELNALHTKPISATAKKHEKKIALDLDKYIRMWDGVVKTKQPDEDLGTSDATHMQKVEKVWQVLLEYKDNWNSYVNILKEHFNGENLYVDAVISDSMVKSGAKQFQMFLKRLEEVGAISKYRVTGQRISFFYDSEVMKRCLLKEGNILELHAYLDMKKTAYDCDQSVKIDWDGVIQDKWSKDVYNEVDVLYIDGNIPTFVSCKGGKMTDGQAVPPLYELSTLATRFGGKYVKKVLATVQEVNGSAALRAKEMGIELKCYSQEK